MARGTCGLEISGRKCLHACSARIIFLGTFGGPRTVVENMEHNEVFSKQPVPGLARSQLP